MPHGANMFCHVPRKLNEPLSADWGRSDDRENARSGTDYLMLLRWNGCLIVWVAGDIQCEFAG
jgi:hypothetical protein